MGAFSPPLPAAGDWPGDRARVPGTGDGGVVDLSSEQAAQIWHSQLGAKDFKTGWFENQGNGSPIFSSSTTQMRSRLGVIPQLEAGVKALLAKLNP